MKHFWDQRFAYEEYIYGKLPNVFFRQFIDNSKSGKLILPAEGEGRNALYALQNGWEVKAVDYSEEGKKKALKLAGEHGYELQYTVADLAVWDENIQADAVGLFYAHFPPAYRKQIHRKLMTKLKRGGKIVLEAFSPEQLNYNSGGPPNIEMLYNSSMLESDFEDMQIEYLEELETEIQEGEYHKGNARIIRMIAKK